MYAHDILAESCARTTSLIRGERETLPSHDPAHCRFGQWLYFSGREQYGEPPLFLTIEQLHREMHSVASMLCRTTSTEQRNPEEILVELRRYLDELIGKEKARLG